MLGFHGTVIFITHTLRHNREVLSSLNLKLVAALGCQSDSLQMKLRRMWPLDGNAFDTSAGDKGRRARRTPPIHDAAERRSSPSSFDSWSRRKTERLRLLPRGGASLAGGAAEHELGLGGVQAATR